MHLKESRNSRSAIRRTLMAFVIAATPLAAVASVSGAAQAGANELGVTAEIVCGSNGAYVDIEINNVVGGGESFDVWVANMPVITNKSPGHINSKKISEGLAEGLVYVEVRSTDGNVLVEDFNLTVACEGVETISCANRSNPVITVTAPENGSSYDVYLLSGSIENVDFDTLDPDTAVDYVGEVGDGDSVDLLPGGNGIFTVAFDGNGGNDSSFTVDVDCRTTIPWRPSPVTAAPLLPSTGSDSNTLMVIAPLMVLLGGALIVARRRLANA